MKRSRSVSQQSTPGSNQQPRSKRMRLNNSKNGFDRLPVPSTVPELSQNPRKPRDDQICAFCLLPGSIRECEGELLGPFKSPYRRGGSAANVLYAHRNCALWSPHVYEGNDGTLKRVDVARKLSRKCILCRSPGASLHCTHKGKLCCRPMHFRCALVGGATLLDGFEAFCPKHSNFQQTEEFKIRLLELGPVSDILLKPGNGCTYCDHDSYNRMYGVILTCMRCNSRAHSKCIFPKDRDAVLTSTTSRSKHFCENCMTCEQCEMPVSNREYKQCRHQQKTMGYEPPDLALDQEEISVLVCHACNYFASHASCVPPDQQKYWRCDRCRVCRHCSNADISKSNWHESKEACSKCFYEIMNGAVVCPMCDKLYREFEGLEMVQCDDCDKWIHAISCGGLTEGQFRKLETAQSESYRCPPCEKKYRRQKGISQPRVPPQESDLKHRKLKKSNFIVSSSTLPPLTEETVFFNTWTAAKEVEDTSLKVMDDLAIGMDLCRLCCTAIAACSLRNCITCGECYHDNCAAMVASIKCVENYKNGLEHMPWVCVACLTDENLENIPALGSIMRRNGSFDHIQSNPIAIESGPVVWPDKRHCELCKRSEYPEGFTGIEGRLLPWRSSMNPDLCDVWVHVGCAILSNGVTLLNENGGTTILCKRREVLGIAKQKTCSGCKYTGATVSCFEKGCNRVFHAVCVEQVGATSELIYASASHCSETSSANKVDSNGTLAQPGLCSLKFSCRNHSKMTMKQLSVKQIMDQMNINDSKIIRILDSQGFIMGSEVGWKRLITMGRMSGMRVGSVGVLRFGTLIPESDKFVVNGCLIPLGYCATRRYWSMRYSGSRCTYMMEVTGHADCGPLFSIRCSEDDQFKIENSDANVAWKNLLYSISKVQPWLNNVRVALTDGLRAFGLRKCAAIVRHIESLPLAAMFGTRYNPIYGVETECSDVVFYEALAKKYQPPTLAINESGSARTEGYLPKNRGRFPNAKSMAPSYINFRSGQAFQMEVVREILCKHFYRNGKVVIGENGGKSTRVEQGAGTMVNRCRRRSLNGRGSVKMVTDTSLNRRVSIVVDNIGREKFGRPTVSDKMELTRVLRSEIDGWGVFAIQDIAANQLIMEYVGELIRPVLSDLREAKYQRMGVGYYMFELLPGLIIDATLCGNAARFINHSCAPNCYSKNVPLGDGTEVVAIFSKRRIQRGEELSYDYQIPYDGGERVICGCGTVQCKGFVI